MELNTAFIERIDLLRFPMALYVTARFRKTYYSTAAWPFNRPILRSFLNRVLHIKMLSLTEFSGGYKRFNQLLIDRMNPVAMNDASSRWVQTQLQSLSEHSLMLTAFQKMLAEMHAALKARSWFLMSQLPSNGRPILYYPIDGSLLEDDPLFHTPAWVTAYNALCHRIEALAACGYAFGASVFLLIQRGVLRKTPEPQRWKIGFDIFNTGIDSKAPDRESFFFDEHTLRAQNILHVVRNRLLDLNTRDFFRDHDISYVEASKLPIPFRYVFSRLCGDFLTFSMRLTLKCLYRPSLLPYLKVANKIIYHNLVRAEILDQTYPTDLFVARDEYGVTHILRTMLHHQRGGRTIGFSHGACLYKQVSVSYLSADTFCFTSPFQQELLQETSRQCLRTCHIGVGIYGLDKTFQGVQSGRIPAPYDDIKKRYRVVGIIGDEFHDNDDVDFNRTSALSFYKAAFSLIQTFGDIYLVVCPKYREFDDPDFQALLLNHADRITLNIQHVLYDLLPIFDAAVSASTTAGLEAIATGRPTVFFDEHRERFNVYEEQMPTLVVHTQEELLRRMESILRGNKEADDGGLEAFKRAHGLRFDGKVRERFRNEVYDLLKEAVAAQDISNA